jgi:hypothetical protein
MSVRAREFLLFVDGGQMIPRILKPANFVHDGKKKESKSVSHRIKQLSGTKIGSQLIV